MRRAAAGLSVRLFEAWLQDRFDLVTSDYLLDEVRLRNASEPMVDDVEVDLVPADVKDNAVLFCAIEGDAGYVVTDDRKNLYRSKQCVPFPRVAGYRVVRSSSRRRSSSTSLRRGDA